MRNEKNGFTLAEVLITLGIIGVIAAITIPMLVKNYQEQQYKIAYKKAYSVASQALKNANEQYLTIDATLAQDSTAAGKNFRAIMSQFNVVKQCVSSNNSLCWFSLGEKYQTAWPTNSEYSFMDSSGYAWSMISSAVNCLLVDTNGFTLPNQYGKDRFAFYMLDEKNSCVGGLPVKIIPYSDNPLDGPCSSPNNCATQKDYYGRSWLYN